MVTRPMRNLPHPQGLLLPLGSPDVLPARASLISEQSFSCIATSLQLSGLDKSPHVLTRKASGCPVSLGVSLTPRRSQPGQVGGPCWPGVSSPEPRKILEIQFLHSSKCHLDSPEMFTAALVWSNNYYSLKFLK